MPRYRIYTLTADQRIFGAPAILNCDNDAKALETARSLMDGQAVELWDGDRRVARLEPSANQVWTAVKKTFGR